MALLCAILTVKLLIGIYSCSDGTAAAAVAVAMEFQS